MDPLAVTTDLIHTQRSALVRVARSEGLSPEDAVECAQDAFATFLEILQRKNEDAAQLRVPADSSEWPAYLTVIARNVARNRRRRHHVARPHDGLEAVDAASPSGPGGASAEELLVAAEDHVRLRACVERLCGNQRSVVMLRLLEERRGEDVASVLGISRGHVDVLLHRAKASLRDCMLE